MKNLCICVVVFLILAIQAAACYGETLKCGVLVTVLQDPLTLGSRAEIEKLVKFATENHIDTLFVQIYRANRSYFSSSIGDAAPYKRCVSNVGEDPFGLLIEKSHASGIKVYAWVNTLSLSENQKAPFIEKYGPDILTCGPSPKRSLKDYKTDKQYFLEPGDLRIRQELVKMTGDIVKAYPSLDGLLFDYIRYPDKDPPYGYTKANITRFKQAYGRKNVREEDAAWKEWKRGQVTETLEALAKKARAGRRDIKIYATTCAPYVRAYHEAFQEWPVWLENGLVDGILLMSYSPDLGSLEKYINEAKGKTRDFKKIDIAIPAYKLVNSQEIFTQQLIFSKNSRPNMCIIYDYESLLKNPSMARTLAAVIKPDE